MLESILNIKIVSQEDQYHFSAKTVWQESASFISNQVVVSTEPNEEGVHEMVLYVSPLDQGTTPTLHHSASFTDEDSALFGMADDTLFWVIVRQGDTDHGYFTTRIGQVKSVTGEPGGKGTDKPTASKQVKRPIVFPRNDSKSKTDPKGTDKTTGAKQVKRPIVFPSKGKSTT